MLFYSGSTMWEALKMLNLIGQIPVSNQSETIFKRRISRNFKHEKVISVGDSKNFCKDFFFLTQIRFRRHQIFQHCLLLNKQTKFYYLFLLLKLYCMCVLISLCKDLCSFLTTEDLGCQENTAETALSMQQAVSVVQRELSIFFENVLPSTSHLQ